MPANLHRSRLLDLVATKRIRFLRLHRHHVAAEIAQQVNVVDQVEEDRPSTLLTPPEDVEIVVRFIEPAGPVDGNKPPQPTFVDCLLGLPDERIVTTVMSDEKSNLRTLGGFDKARRPGDIIRDRLLDERRYARRDAFGAIFDMHLVGRGDDDPVRLCTPDHCRKIRKPSHPLLFGKRFCGPRRTDDGHELGARLRQDAVDMTFADQTSAENGQLDRPLHLIGHVTWPRHR
jgi:hypothetical protein